MSEQPDYSGNERRRSIRTVSELTPETHIKMTIYLFIILIISIVSGVIGGTVAVIKMFDRVDTIQRTIDMHCANSYEWADHTQFTLDLNRELAKLTPPIQVPVQVHKWISGRVSMMCPRDRTEETTQ